MGATYHINPSGKNLQCQICGGYIYFSPVRVCQVCGIIICKSHFYGGFCEKHYKGLTDEENQKVQECIQNKAKIERIDYLLLLAVLLSGLSPFFWKIIVNPSGDFPILPFQVLFGITGFTMIGYSFVHIFQRDANAGEIQKIVKKYQNKQNDQPEATTKVSRVEQDLRCPNCGNYNLANARFCSTCGKEMEMKIEPGALKLF
jgi:hypothetical protein